MLIVQNLRPLASAWMFALVVASGSAYASGDDSFTVHLPHDPAWQKPGCARHSCSIYPLKSYILGSTDKKHRYRYSPKLAVETSPSGRMSIAYLFSVPTLSCRSDETCPIRISSGQHHADLDAKNGSIGLEILSVADLVTFVDRYPRFQLHFASDRGPVVVSFPSKDVVSAPYTGRY
jgi:hypothetical protein